MLSTTPSPIDSAHTVERALPAASSEVQRLTPPGTAALTVVRLHGPAVIGFCARFLSATPKRLACRHVDLKDEIGTFIDDPVVVANDDASVDLSLHGGEWIAATTLELAQRSGFSVVHASVDEALLSRGADAIDREVLEALPQVTTELGLAALLAQPAAWRTLEMHGAARISSAEAERIVHDQRIRRLLVPQSVALVGLPNAGKSTLCNALLASDRSIVADLPGTTRDWVETSTNFDGLPARILDTPGIANTADVIERAAVAAAGRRVAQADCVILVLDGARPLAGEQANLLAAFPNAIRVVNKSDQPPAFDRTAVSILHCVAKSGIGVDGVIGAIRAHFGFDTFDPHAPHCWTASQSERLRRLAQAGTTPLSGSHS